MWSSSWSILMSFRSWSEGASILRSSSVVLVILSRHWIGGIISVQKPRREKLLLRERERKRLDHLSQGIIVGLQLHFPFGDLNANVRMCLEERGGKEVITDSTANQAGNPGWKGIVGGGGRRNEWKDYFLLLSGGVTVSLDLFVGSAPVLWVNIPVNFDPNVFFGFLGLIKNGLELLGFKFLKMARRVMRIEPNYGERQ